MKPLLLGFVLAALSLAAAKPDDLERQLKAAINQEVVDGDIKGAIEQYKKVAQSGNSATAARALLRLGEAYEKVGDSQARKVFERVVAQYPGQPEAAQARARLNAKAEATQVAAPTEVTLWRTSQPVSEANCSAAFDGSFIVCDAWVGGGLRRRDLVSGEETSITADRAFYPEVSPDGKFVAYDWNDSSRTELRLIGTDGSNPRVLARADRSKTVLFVPEAWSPDGSRLLVHRDRELGLISLADGSTTFVQSMGSGSPVGGGMGIGSTPNAFSPDGRYIVYKNLDDRIAPPNKAEYVIWIMDSTGGGATRLLSDPAGVAAEAPMWTPDGRSVIFRSNRGGSWAVWSVAMSDGKPLGAPQLLLKDDVRPLGIAKDGSLFLTGVFLQANALAISLDPRTLKAVSGPQQMNRLFIGQANGPVVWAPDGRSAVYTGGGNLVLHSFDTDEDRVIKTGGAGAISYCSDGAAVFGLKRIDSDAGSAWRFTRIDLRSGEETFVFETPVKVQDANISADGKTVYYAPSIPREGGTALVIRRDIQTGAQEQVFQTSAKLLANISVSPDGQQIAFYYQDLDGVGHTIVAPAHGGAAKDLLQGDYMITTEPWMADGRHLFVGNRQEYFSISVQGGPPQSVAPWGGPYTASPLGDRIAFISRQPSFELKLYKNLLTAAQ